MAIDCKAASSYGEQWRNSIRGYFASRIEAGHISIFNNGPAAMKRV